MSDQSIHRNIERFNDGTGEVGKYVGHFDGMASTTISEGSRNMAKPAVFTSKYESFKEEFDDLKRRKKDLEFQLGNFSSAIFAKEQLRIRDQFKNNKPLSIRKWIEKKAELEEQKKKLTQEIISIDQRIILIKPRVKDEAREQHSTSHVASSGEGNDRPFLLDLVCRTNELLEAILCELKSMKAVDTAPTKTQ